MRRFRDRHDAGRALGALLDTYATMKPLVLGLPRGGVPVAFEVARALHCPLDVFIVRKLGVPGNEELAMGAIASGGAVVLNEDIVSRMGVTDAELQHALTDESRELQRRELLYRAGRDPVPVAGRTVILVDDGMATGASVRVAIQALRTCGPKAIVVGVPVASRDALLRIRGLCDDWASVIVPDPFHGVGAWYDDFTQTADDEVRQLHKRSAAERETISPGLPRSA